MKHRKVISRLLLAVLFLGAHIISVTNVSAVSKYDERMYSANDILFFDDRLPVCSVDDASVAKLSGKDNREKIWNYLKIKGLTSEQAAGVLGNIQSESGGTFSPTVFERGYEEKFDLAGYGIVQWTNSPRGEVGKTHEGRRQNVVNFMTVQAQTEMNEYYKKEYGLIKSATGADEGFIAKNATTGELMPVEANDKLLLAQLEFLYSETIVRNLHGPAVERGYGTSSDNEWEVLKKQKSIKDATIVWLASFEIPADIDGTAVARVKNAEAIYEMYSKTDGGSGSICDSKTDGATSNKQALAKSILDTKNVSYWPTSGPDLDGSKNLIKDVASGKNDGNKWPCGVNANILKIILSLAEHHKVTINSMNNGCAGMTVTGPLSPHVAGNGSAVDFGPIDGGSPYSKAGANTIIKAAGDLLVRGSRVGQSNCPAIASLDLPKGVTRFTDNCSHLHVDVPPSVDPSLECKSGILSCPKSQRV